MKPINKILCLIGVMASIVAINAQAREYIQIVGSSTVYPFATVVAERFGKTTNFKTPVIESTGSGGGMKLFCAGIGKAHPDFTNASRRIKSSEFKKCQANGITEIIEIKVGYDGIILGNSLKAEPLSITLQDIFLALAKEVPNPDGSASLIQNPYKTWREVNTMLPAIKIEVLGPPPTSGTRDAFVELAMEGGCKRIDWIVAMKKTDKKTYKSVCHTIREDGAFIETGENDNLIVQKLRENPKALGIFGFSFLDQNTDIIQGALIDGIPAEFEAIADGSYPISRPLYVYAKKAHIVTTPGMQEYMNEFTSEAAFGEDGYLADKGLIPMPNDERTTFSAAVKNLTPLSL